MKEKKRNNLSQTELQRVGLSLGSNLGNKGENISQAVKALSALKVPCSPLLVAPVFESKPLECPPNSPNFYNTFIEICFIGKALDFLDKIQKIEREFGREKTLIVNAPRQLDIDIIYFGNLVCETEKLICPHPQAYERLFVIEPLKEIRPLLRLPKKKEMVIEIYENLIKTDLPLSLVK